MSTHRPRGLRLITLLGVAVLATACGDDASTNASAPIEDDTTTADTPTADTPAATAAPGTGAGASDSDSATTTSGPPTTSSSPSADTPTTAASAASTPTTDAPATTAPPTTAPPTTTYAVPTSGSPQPGSGSIDQGLQPFIDLAARDLAGRIGVEVRDIVVERAVITIWSDGAIGCPDPKMAYTQVPVDGSAIELHAAGDTWWYHSGGAVSPFLCTSPLRETPA